MIGQVIHYRAGAQPVLLGGMRPLSNDTDFSPILATRGGALTEPLYYWEQSSE